ncbi:MAG TPA: ATP-binding protein [Burkholderiales bacterium]
MAKAKLGDEGYRAMFENAGVGITRVDLNGALADVNQKFCEMLGYTRNELLAMPLKALTHPDDYGQGAAFRGQLTRGATRSATGEKRFLHKDRRIIWARRTMSIVQDEAGNPEYVISIVEDITERKLVEQRQTIEHAVTRLLADSGSIAETMPRVIQIIGDSLGYAYGARWVIDKNDRVLRSRESWCIGDEAVDAFRRMSTASVETPGKPGGLNRKVWSTNAPVWIANVAEESTLKRRDAALQAGLHSAFAFSIVVGGEFYGVMEFFSRDIRPRDERVLEIAQTLSHQIGQFIARIHAEAALRVANEQLTRKAQELTRSNAELEQFAYVASHDLQEPLRMIASYTQLILRRYGDRLDSDAREFMDFVVDGAARMKQLIEDLLAYSRVGTHGKQFERTDCEAVLKKARANLRVAIENHAAVITQDPLPTLDADDTQLVQLFQNLLGNAIKFRGPQAPSIHISAQENGANWLFGVADKGIGIDPQYFERIFMVFQRLHNKTEYPGTGIGLAICKKVVDRHGGRIWVESKPNEGSKFCFTLPKKREIR